MDLYSYDTAGNLLNDGTHQYFYDAENHLIQVDGTPGYCSTLTGTAATACYGYDSLGRRGHRTGVHTDNCDGTGKRDYAYDLSDRWVLEVNSNQTACTSQIYAGGRHLTTYYDGNVMFEHTDWLGTLRRENSIQYPTTGYHDCTSLPFGDALHCTWYNDTLHFTGKERDQETGLDYFGARFNSSNFGRFMTPDWSAKPQGVPYAVLDDPQSLNLYAYVRNNPLNRTDPSGHCTADGEKHGFWWCVGHALGINETQKEFNARINNERQWLLSNAARNGDQTNALRNASAAQVDNLYWQWTKSLEQARCGGFLNYCENVLEAKDYQRASDGSFVPLVRLHGDSTITQGNSAGYQYWSGKSTQEIIESLKPGAESPLTVRPNGTILDGNTRIKILEERGIDINKLERVIIEKVPLDPLP